VPARWTATFAGHAQDAGLGAEPAAARPVSDAAGGLRLDDANPDPGQPMERATPEDRTRRRSTPAWVPIVLVAVVYAVLSAFANGSAWAHGVAHTLQTSGGNDVGEEVWFLAETPWILLHGHNPFANDWLNTPVGVDLMDNTTMPVLGVLFAPVTLLFGPVATFNVVLDVSIWASAMSFFLMARRFVRWWPAAFVGGLLYGFSPYTAAVGNGHLFLLFQAAPPLIILFLDRFLRSDTASPWWAGFWVGACYVVQFYVSTEAFACLLVMTLWAVVLALAYVLWRRPAVDWARLARLGACAVAVVVLFTGYAAWTAVDGPEHVNGPVQSLSATAGQSTDPVGLVVPTLNQRFTLGHTALGNTLVAARDPQWHLVLDSLIENGTYVGIPLLVALVAAVAVLRRRRVVQFSAFMGASALLVSMGTRLHVAGHRTPIRLPFIVFTHLPLFDSSVAARWITYFWLFAALILAVTIDAVRARLTARTSRGSGLAALGVCTLLAACVLVPLVPAWPYASASVRVPAWFTGAARSLPLGTTLVVYPWASPSDSSAMLWQAEADLRFKMTGGYGIFANPAGTIALGGQITPLEATLTACEAGATPTLSPAAVRSQLHAVGASIVVVVPTAPGAPCAEQILEAALGQPENTEGVLLWRT